MKAIFLFLLIFSSIHCSVAQQRPQFPYEEMEKTATQFFESYKNLKADDLVSLYTDDVEFLDETYAGQGGEPGEVNGKEELRKWYKNELFLHAKEFDWQEENRFFSGNQGVFRGVLKVYYKGTIAKKSEDITYSWTAPYVVVLNFEDGKIAKIKDHFDYRASIWVEEK